MGERAGRRTWVGVDLGTQSVRAVAVAEDGERLATASRPLTSRRDGVRHEQDPEQWWAQASDALAEVAALAGRSAALAGVAVSGTSGTVVVLDERGEAVTPGVMYDDARGAAHLPRVLAAGEELWARLGHRPQASWALPTLLALAEDGALRPGTRVVHQPDVVTERLVGSPVPSDSSHALKTGLDLDALAWPQDAMAALGLPVEALPPVVLPGTVIGHVALPGPLEGAVVVAGMTDGCAAQLAAGAVTPGSWNSVLGTTLVVKGAAAQRRTDPTGAVYSHRAPFGAGWWPGGASSTGAGALSAWLPGRDPASLVAPDGAPVAYPLVGRGERFPFVAPQATAFGMPPDGAADAALFSAVAHGVAYVERLCFDLLGLAGFDTTGPLTATGGGARNPWWNQLRADVLGRPLMVPEDGEGARGMALLAAASEEGALGPVAERMLGPVRRVDPRAGAPSPALTAGYTGFVDEVARRGWVDQALAHHARAGAR